MNNFGDNMTKSIGGKLTPTEKSITHAILGIPSVSHGAKLSLNMNSKDRNNLLMQLEQRRLKRIEKLASRILEKGKQINNSKLQLKPKTKMRPPSNTPVDLDGKQIKKTVYDRLSEKDSRKDITKKSEKKIEKSTLKKASGIKPFIIEDIEIPTIVISESETVVDKPDSSLSPDLTETKTQVEEVVVKTVEQYSEIGNSPEKSDTDAENEISELPCSYDSTVENVNVEINENINPPDELKVTKDENVKMNKDNNKKEKKTVKTFKIPFSGNGNLKAKKTLRRSISLIFRQKKRDYESAILRTQSEDNIKSLVEENEMAALEATSDVKLKSDGLGIKEEVGRKLERARVWTPKQSLTSTADLRNKLENWLIEKGQSIDTYKHLQCFGLNMEKMPIHRVQRMDDSFNASLYSTAPNTPIVDINDESDKENVTPPALTKTNTKDVEGYLSDLYRLIVHIKYPSNRCEEWLNAISKKFPSCKNLPVFWECEAAIYGDPTEEKHIKDTQNEEDNTDNCLAQMLDKLVIDENCHSASKTERGLSMENIFRSKTVKFALKEMKVRQADPTDRKEEKVLVATPVRRSARIQTPYKSNVVGSLKSLDPETRRKVSFQPNDALLTG